LTDPGNLWNTDTTRPDPTLGHLCFGEGT